MKLLSYAAAMLAPLAVARKSQLMSAECMLPDLDGMLLFLQRKKGQDEQGNEKITQVQERIAVTGLQGDQDYKIHVKEGECGSRDTGEVLRTISEFHSWLDGS